MKLEEIISRMHNHGLYNSDDSELAEEQLRYLDMVYDYNHIKPSHLDEKEKLLKKMFAQIGEGCHIETPFYANWGGTHWPGFDGHDRHRPQYGQPAERKLWGRNPFRGY